jgi:hypothetical protein
VAGWEELTPDQLIFIMLIVFSIVIIHHVCVLIRSLINLKISNNIKLRVEKELLNEVQEQVNKPPFFNKIKLWWAERKTRKEEYY